MSYTHIQWSSITGFIGCIVTGLQASCTEAKAEEAPYTVVFMHRIASACKEHELVVLVVLS